MCILLTRGIESGVFSTQNQHTIRQPTATDVQYALLRNLFIGGICETSLGYMDGMTMLSEYVIMPVLGLVLQCSLYP